MDRENANASCTSDIKSRHLEMIKKIYLQGLSHKITGRICLINLV